MKRVSKVSQIVRHITDTPSVINDKQELPDPRSVREPVENCQCVMGMPGQSRMVSGYFSNDGRSEGPPDILGCGLQLASHHFSCQKKR
ncbi:hypothetical protein CTAM01_14684 [Colletotrichum tamarilloi]|uniref:Uncharacterized protein n=1 Tax=Colletotrichum tamarilloi TaxID=1209934 RepID=A0ABQ9QNG6_9PEZI|nr:uncharacterized protein CTAM01_14684 [Colletotrichum tamarilloi]KAK1479337.1 hypothetical protein CTAM01_14684 [Colletotrichum tamarilloi]